MNTKRNILWFVFAFSVFMIWSNYVVYTTPKVDPQVQTVGPNEPTNPDYVVQTTPVADETVNNSRLANVSGDLIDVNNKHYKLQFDLQGARLVYASILSETSGGSNNSFSLLDHRKDRMYITQNGLAGTKYPNQETLFKLVTPAKNNGETTTISFEATKGGVHVLRTFTINNSTYLINVEDRITNNTTQAITPSMYYQILRANVEDERVKNDTGFSRTFSGFAEYSDENKYHAEKLSDLTDDPISQTNKDGWIAGVEHYFLTAWLPDGKIPQHVQTEHIKGSDIYTISSIQKLPTLNAGQTIQQNARLWVGPQIQTQLEQVDPTLKLSVDYGWMTFLAKPVFSLMIWLQSLIGNWGWTIIVLTLLIKVLLYPLVAKSQKSMAKMKLLQPRMQLLKEKFGDDKEKLNQAMMEMYKAEKVNPMGGCLPILLTIPVFLTLYRVILYSVEMRGAAWLGWITDLSVSDPYYILPAIMIASMFLQFKLNPTPVDKMQARMMMIMPIVFGFMMIWFPSGMVIYWTVNNIFSIAQQWYINRKIEQEKNEQILTHR